MPLCELRPCFFQYLGLADWGKKSWEQEECVCLKWQFEVRNMLERKQMGHEDTVTSSDRDMHSS